MQTLRWFGNSYIEEKASYDTILYNFLTVVLWFAIFFSLPGKGGGIVPRLYITPIEFQLSPMGLNPSVQAIISQLAPGVIDQLIARASERCDMYCQKRLQAPASTSLSQGVSAGATTISVASTITFDNLAELAVIIDTGSNQETVQITPGGVTVTSWLSPYPGTYPGTVSLQTGLQFGHSSGAPVQLVYKEVTEAGSSSSSDPYTEALQTQAMQLALAHLPPARTALTRTVFLKAFPIISLIGIEHAFSFTNQFNQVDLSIESIVPSEGWYRFSVGTVILREGLMRTTYTGGYSSIPDDIKTACSLYLAEQLGQFVNPFGLQQLTMGKRTQRWDTSKAKHFLVEEAEDILKKYRRII